MSPVKKGDAHWGALALDFLGRARSPRRAGALPSIAELLGSAFDNARAYQVETDARMRHAADEERTRLARDLHDSITQALSRRRSRPRRSRSDDIPLAPRRRR